MGGSFVGKEQDATKGVYAQAGTCTAFGSVYSGTSLIRNKDTSIIRTLSVDIQPLKPGHLTNQDASFCPKGVRIRDCIVFEIVGYSCCVLVHMYMQLYVHVLHCSC